MSLAGRPGASSTSEDTGGSISLGGTVAIGVDVEFALSGCSEFVRSVGVVVAGSSLILDGEEGTDSAAQHGGESVAGNAHWSAVGSIDAELVPEGEALACGARRN